MQLVIRLLRPICHAAIIGAIFYALYHLRQSTDLIPGMQLRVPVIPFEETMVYAALAAVMFVIIAMVKKLYELHKPRHHYFARFSKTRIYWIITMTFIAYFGQGFIFIGGISRFIIALGGISTFVLLGIFDRGRNILDDRLQRRKANKILIIAHSQEDGKRAIPFLYKYQTTQYDIIEPKQRNKNKSNDYHTTIAVGNFERRFLQQIFDFHRLSSSRLFHLAEGFLLQDVVYKAENIGNTVALEYTHSTLDGRANILKRICDLIASLIATIVLIPVFIIIAIVIKIDSPGPIFYVQKRVGRYGRLFNFIKFRSMYTHLSTGNRYGGQRAEQLYQDLIDSDQNIRSGELPKIINDPRVTKVGKFLRKTSLDELPNLFSVIRGNMSIVGPRPHMPNEIEKYKSRQKRLLSIKPGITGYAQIFGRDTLTFNQEAKLDLYYIQHRSIWMDAYIIIMTLKVIFNGK